jgi:hypothetical protein
MLNEFEFAMNKFQVPSPKSQGIRLGRIFLELGAWNLGLGAFFLQTQTALVYAQQTCVCNPEYSGLLLTN